MLNTNDDICMCWFAGEFPPEYTNDSDDDEDYIDDETASMSADKRAASPASGSNEPQANG